MKPKATEAPGYRGKRGILDRRAKRMREYNLTHGSGCKSTARAIKSREALRSIDIRRGDIWDLLTNTGMLRRTVRSVACGRVSYIDADGRFTQCDVGAFKRWARSAFLHAADDWTGRNAEGRAIAKRSGGGQ